MYVVGLKNCSSGSNAVITTGQPAFYVRLYDVVNLLRFV